MLDLAFDIAAAVNAAADAEGVSSALMQALGAFGFSTTLAGVLPPPDYCGPVREGHLLIAAYPHEWMQHYNAQGYVYTDPIIRRLRTDAQLFGWSKSLMIGPGQPPDVSRMFGEAAEFGLKAGVAMAFRAPGGALACLSLAGERIDVPPRYDSAVGVIGAYAVIRAMSLKAAQLKRPRLSKREIECIKWAAEGKTEWEIGGILSISENTVENHLANARRKLGAANRAQMTALAIRLGIIV